MRESSEFERLSPIMKYWPFGTWTGPNASWGEEMYGSFRKRQPDVLAGAWSVAGAWFLQTQTLPSTAPTHSPGRPIRRLTNVTLATWSTRSALSPKPFGWKTRISPRAGSVKRYRKRAARIRSPTCSVVSIDGDGTRYGLTIQSWVAYAMASAITSVIAVSITGCDRKRENAPRFFGGGADGVSVRGGGGICCWLIGGSRSVSARACHCTSACGG